MQATELFSHARRAVLWGTGAKWLDILGSTLSFLVIARLLGPESFGVFGLVLVALTIPEIIVGGAISDSIIQKPDLRPGHVAGIFWFQLGLAILFAAGLWLAAPLLARAMGSEQLSSLIPVLAASLPIMAISGVPAALLQRELRFRAIAIVDAIGTVCAAIVGVALALYGFGVLALVLMEVARRLIRALCFLYAARRAHAMRTSIHDISEMMHFSLATLGVRLLAQADIIFPRLLLGLVDARALGYFNLALRIYQQGSAIFVAPLYSAVLPLASRIQGDHAKLGEALDAATRVSTLTAYPIFVGAAAIAPTVVPLMLGPDWVGGILTIQLMLLLGVRAATAAFNSGVFMATGRPGIQLGITTLSVSLMALFSWIAAPWGSAAVAAAQILRGSITWFVSANVLQRVIGHPARRQFEIGWESLVSSAVMGAAVLGAQYWAGGQISPWLLTPGLLVLGVLTHFSMMWLLAPSIVRHMAQIAGAIVRRDGTRLSELLSPARGVQP